MNFKRVKLRQMKAFGMFLLLVLTMATPSIGNAVFDSPFHAAENLDTIIKLVNKPSQTSDGRDVKAKQPLIPAESDQGQEGGS